MIQELQTGLLDINNKYNVDFSCKQLDDIILKIIVYDKSLPADLSNYNVRLKAFKADQVPLIQNTNITSKDNVVTIKADKQLTTTNGIVKAELQFINKTTLEKKSTFYLEIKVAASVLDVDGVVSTPTCTILEEIDNKLDQIEDIKLDVLEAIKVKNDLNTSKIDANSMNNTLKATTTNADNKKKEVETAINNASNKIKEVQDSTNAANTAKQAVDSSVVQANASKQALDTSKTNADNTKRVVDNSIKIADEKIEIIKQIDPENIVQKVNTLENKVLKNELTPIETDSVLTKLPNCIGEYVHNMQIRGKTLQNLSPNTSSDVIITREMLKVGVYSIKLHVINNSGEKRLLFVKDGFKYNTFSEPIVLEIGDNKDVIFNNIKINSIEGLGNIYINVLKPDYTPASGVVFSQKMCLEGDWSNKEIPPYFEGIKSTGELEGNKISILTKGKNLLNVNGELTLSYNGDGTKEHTHVYDYYAYLEKGKKYTFSCETDSTSWGTIQGIDTVEAHLLKDKEIKTFFTMWSNPYTFTCNETGKYYLRLDINKNNTTHSFWNIQVVEGTTATAYEEHKEDKTEILLPSPHMGLPNGTADVVDYDKNERIKNVDKIIIDGSCDFGITGMSNRVNTILFEKREVINNIKLPVNTGTKFININNFNSRFSAPDDLWNSDIEGITCEQSGKIRISILKSRLETPDVAGFKKWLQANPTTVYYQLANPITEKLNIKDTLQSFMDGYIQLDNAITPYSSLEYSTNLPSAIGSLTQITDKLVDDVTNVEITISDMDAEIDEARKGKATLEERLEEDRTNILKTIGDLNILSTTEKANLVSALNEILGITNQLSNPSLLINGDFIINQREQLIYTLTGISNYTVDRWISYNLTDDITEVVKLDKGIKLLSKSGGSARLRQTFESDMTNRLKEKTVTFSMKVIKDCSMVALTVTKSKNITGFSKGFNNVKAGTILTHTFMITNDYENLGIQFSTNDTNGLEVEWVKLELGSVATPFVPRLYGEELALCKRYYEIVNRCFRACGVINKNGLLVIDYPFFVQKRVRPTVTIPSDLTNSLELTYIKAITPTALQVADVSLSGLRLTASIAETGYLGQTVECNLAIPVDSEIY
ncbi:MULTISPECIES: hypothetical protein [Clostridium]|uniref:hypothetical protein n=1 Tax=Clostridium TaxID=1485 RepID=UPI002079CF9B|nr:MULTISPECIES: hypothetical protein [Clostridium]